jgi:AcrR family transcriptional regulator
MEVFWERGYAAASLDDLGAAMRMNRPSIYAAFGDKEALYAEALKHFRARVSAAFAETFTAGRPLREALREFYARAMRLYVSGRGAPRGCFVIGTALTEAVGNPALRASLADGLQRLDRAFAARIAAAQQQGEIAPDANPADRARVASAMLYLIAIQARAGEPRRALKATVDAAVAAVCA